MSALSALSRLQQTADSIWGITKAAGFMPIPGPGPAAAPAPQSGGAPPMDPAMQQQQMAQGGMPPQQGPPMDPAMQQQMMMAATPPQPAAGQDPNQVLADMQQALSELFSGLDAAANAMETLKQEAGRNWQTIQDLQKQIMEQKVEIDALKKALLSPQEMPMGMGMPPGMMPGM